MRDSKNSILLKDTSKNSILRLVLNDEKNRNALSEDMIIELNEEIQKVNLDELFNKTDWLVCKIYDLIMIAIKYHPIITIKHQNITHADRYIWHF